MRLERLVERGGAIIFALMVSFLLFALGYAQLSLTLASHRWTAKTLDGDVAYYIAEAGANEAVNKIMTGGGTDLTAGVLGSAANRLPWALPDGTSGTYYTTVDSAKLTVKSYGTYRNVDRILVVTLKIQTPSVVMPFVAAIETMSRTFLTELGAETRLFTYESYKPGDPAIGQTRTAYDGGGFAGSVIKVGERKNYPIDVNGVPPNTADLKGIDIPTGLTSRNVPINSTDKYGSFGLLVKAWGDVYPKGDALAVFGEVKAQGYAVKTNNEGTYKRFVESDQDPSVGGLYKVWKFVPEAEWPTTTGEARFNISDIIGNYYHGDTAGHATAYYAPNSATDASGPYAGAHTGLDFSTYEPFKNQAPPPDVDVTIAALRGAGSAIANKPRTYEQAEAELDTARALVNKASGWTSNIADVHETTVTVTIKGPKDGGGDMTPKTCTWSATGDLFVTNGGDTGGVANTGKYDAVYFPTGNYYFNSIEINSSRKVHFGAGSKVYVNGIAVADSTGSGVKFNDGDIIFDGSGELVVKNGIYIPDGAGASTTNSIKALGNLNVAVGGHLNIGDDAEGSVFDPRLYAQGGDLTVNLTNTTAATKLDMEFGATNLVKVNADHLGGGTQGATIRALNRYDIYVRNDFSMGGATGAAVLEGAENTTSYLLVGGNASLGSSVNKNNWGYLTADNLARSGSAWTNISTRRNPRERIIFVKGLTTLTNADGSVQKNADGTIKYGTTPKAGPNVDSKDIDGGNLLVYAPGCSCDLGTSSSDISISGAIIADYITTPGQARLAYDTTLGSGFGFGTSTTNQYTTATKQQEK